MMSSTGSKANTGKRPSASAPSVGALPPREGGKLGERIATSLGNHIARINLQVGDQIGSEAELAVQFETSRWTMREALSILHREGLVEIRRGRSGGYFVAHAGTAPFSGAMRAYFEFLGVGIPEIIEARRILGMMILRMATHRLALADVPRMRSAPTSHQALLTAAGNPVAQKFARSARRFEKIALLRSSFALIDYTGMIGQINAMRTEQMEAVIADDFHAAWGAEIGILAISEAMLERSFVPARDQSETEFLARMDGFFGNQVIGKTDMFTHRLSAEIIARNWPSGERLGSEQQLMARYGIGRSVLREAVRPLEQTGLVIMHKGRDSGLKVGRPTLESLVSVSMEQFARLRATERDYAETLVPLLAGAAGLAARRKARIGQTGDFAAFAQAVADASGNRIIATMIRLLVARNVALQAGGHVVNEASDIRLCMADAIAGGDAPLAQRAALCLLAGTSGATSGV